MASEVNSGRILSISMGDFVGRCYADEVPPCGYACPIGLDIIGFISKLQRGNFDGAYKIFLEQAVFPEIVCRICDAPCETECLRLKIDGSIPLKKLERVAVEYARQTGSPRYSIKKKEQSIAIVGAGMGGLACAVTLSAFGYDVTVYDSHLSYGHDLQDLLPEDEYLPLLAQRLSSADIEFRLGLDAPCDDKERSFVAELPAPEGAGNPVAAIKEGVDLALRTDQLLKTGTPPDEITRGFSHCANILGGYSDLKPLARVHGDSFTKEEAKAEASVCMQCKCDFCKRTCDFMRHYDVLPKKIARDVKVNFNPVEGLQRRIATRMINSCYDCGRCKDVCSEGIDVGKFLLEARSIMQREGSLPPAFHEFWIRDMEHAMGEDAFFARNAPGKSSSSYLFFPGCRLGASEPAYVETAYRYLSSRMEDVGILAACCGIPAVWGGDMERLNTVIDTLRGEWDRMGKPKLICACLSCMKTLTSYFPEAEIISLYTVIEKYGLPEAERVLIGGNSAETLGVSGIPSEAMVFDPCSASGDKDTAAGVRALLKSCGVKISDDERDKFATSCCGFGGHIYPANESLYGEIVKNRITASELPYITYCINCNDIFQRNGKLSRHILDVVFPGARTCEKLPDCSDYRRNRELLKSGLLRSIWEEETAEISMSTVRVEIDDVLREKMDKQLILTDDVVTTVTFCEAEHCGILDSETGIISGHKKIGECTYWVQYKIEEDICRLVNAYKHRLTIEGEAAEVENP